MTVDVDTTQLKTYRGNCHCGSYVFEVTVPELTSVTVCDCSICTKKNYMYLWMTPGRDSFKVVKDEGLLTDYSFGGSFGISHQFCSKCGISLIGKTKDGMVLNARTLQDVDLWNVEIKTCDGASLDPQYKPPVYTGPEPTLPPDLDPDAIVNGGKTYHGSCHCGAITAAVKLPQPLEDKALSKERIVECNCSICMRAGFTWIYPLRCQVLLYDTTTKTDPAMNLFSGNSSSTKLRSYAFNRGVFVKTFCSVCGVYLTNEFNTALTPEQVAAFPAETQAFRQRMQVYRPFNLRVLNDFDFKTLGRNTNEEKGGSSRIERLDGAGRPPFYVNP